MDLVPLPHGRFTAQIFNLDETSGDSPHVLHVSFQLRTSKSVEVRGVCDPPQQCFNAGRYEAARLDTPLCRASTRTLSTVALLTSSPLLDT